MAAESSSRPTRPSCRFVDKVAIVTGSSCGLGLEVALQLAREGACVTLTGRDEKKLADAKKRCQIEAEAAAKDGGAGSLKKNVSGKFLTVSGDLTISDVRKAIVDQTMKTFGRLDVLVCNAGVFPANNNIYEATEEIFDEIMAVNVKGTFFVIQHALPHLEKFKGNVIITSSALSIAHGPAATLYNASKAAVDNLTSNLALTLAPKEVRVNAVSPSYIPTQAMRHWAPQPDAVEAAAQRQADYLGPKHPLYGRCAEPADFAKLVLFLASDEARCITGQTSVLDSGITLVGAFSDWVLNSLNSL
ncbi:hypothetical protein EGW08_015512 [Elysia chlorotica]|uniref:Uncharacterized protein n=1 Tax=Elysia chlorotica TaxID=188477 RepID=A0A3S1HCS7_ELYCH|nr:hypothetical protein EGW08_015512 [Elysia chlorotica]